MPQPNSHDVTVAEHLRRAAEHAPIGIICVSGATGSYVFANAAFARMIGRTQEEVMNADPYDISVNATHPDDRLPSRQAMERIAQGEMDTHRYEKRLLRKDGSVLWTAVDMLATRDPEGRLAFLTLYFTDIHAQRSADDSRARLEDQLRQAQKVQALGRLAGGVAHDFNNRLAVIMGYAEILSQRLPDSSPFRSHADHVLQSAKRAGELTRQLLAYGRRQVLKPQVFDLGSVVERMRDLLERLLGEDIQMITALNADRPILADPGQMEQVIINLAINARDAMSQGGRFTLETRDATVSQEDSGALAAGEYVELVVSDSGVGIPEDLLPRIFEPFFTTKEIGRGTGLGLSTVEGIVAQSGGSIRVESRIGEGTTFRILLPRGTEMPAAPKPRTPAPLPRGLSLETVLVCDDDEDVLELVANVLGLRGYTLLKASDGREAMRVATQHDGPIHLLVTDLVMPALGGQGLFAELRARHPDLRVLYVSGYSDDAGLVSGKLEPGVGFLAKPFLPSELTQLVTSMLETPIPGVRS